MPWLTLLKHTAAPCKSFWGVICTYVIFRALNSSIERKSEDVERQTDKKLNYIYLQPSESGKWKKGIKSGGYEITKEGETMK